MAYSLLGLFGINMPLIYGEGSNAFFRLQCEIIQNSVDESIFAWADEQLSHGGLLARNPSAFQSSNDIVPIYIQGFERAPYHMTHKGLAIEFNVQVGDSVDCLPFSDSFGCPEDPLALTVTQCWSC